MKPEQGRADVKGFSPAKKRKTLRNLRVQAGLSLAEVGVMTKLSESSLSRFESGKRGLSPAALTRVEKAIADVLSYQKKFAEFALTQPGQMLTLRQLMGQGQPPPPGVPLPQMEKSETAEERIKKLEEQVESLIKLHDSDQELVKRLKDHVEGYRNLHETDVQIIEMLKQTGPGSVAMEGVKLLDEVEKLRAENAQLREWLDAEYAASLQDAKAKELREKVHAEIAPAEEPEDG